MGDGVVELESMIEKICDLHDKLSDAIHSVSRAHFLDSVKNPRKSDEFPFRQRKKSPDERDPKTVPLPGFVFVKYFRADDGESAIHEAKSLYAIRSALENLEDQLNFFHMVQMQQLTERDSAIARLEQSRIILAMRLAEHQGKKYNIIDEVQALVGDIENAGLFVSPEHLSGSTPYPSGTSIMQQKGMSQNPVVKFFFSTLTFVSNSLKLDHTAGILCNAALVAISMLAFMHMNRDPSSFARETRKVYRTKDQTSNELMTKLDVLLARG